MIFVDEEGTKGREVPQTYDGFCSAGSWEITERPKKARFLAVAVWHDGWKNHTKLWWLENDGAALEELWRFYRSMVGPRKKLHAAIELFRPKRKRWSTKTS